MLSTQRRGRFRTYLQQLVTRHTNSVAQLPRWRHPLLGYLIGLLLVGLALAIGLVEIQLQSPFAFPGALLLFAVVLVALFWGAGSAVFTILLSLLTLDYLYVPPFGTFGAYGWSGMLQLLTFVSACIIIALLTNQREVARLRALVAEREAVLRANQLSATFEAIDDSVVVYNKQGEVFQTNAATHRLFGLNASSSKDKARLRQELLLQAVQHDEQGKLLPEKRRPLSRLLAGEVLTGTQRVWERFYRVPGIGVQSGSEEGLGVELHGRQIGVDSRSGEGSTFWFTLPLTWTDKRNEEIGI